MFSVFSQDIDYPPTKKVIVSDTFHTYIINDEYRWLEDTENIEVEEWVEKQNDISKKFLRKVTSKYNIYNKIGKNAHAKYNFPRKSGKYYYKYAYYDVKGVYCLFYQKYIRHRAELLIDPNFISRKDVISLKGHYPSRDSKYLAYEFGRNGSDWAEIQVVSLVNGSHNKDHIDNVKFSNVEWKDDGFFYSSFPRGEKYGQSVGERVYYHKLGTKQEEDKLIFKRKNPNLKFSFLTTHNERFFIIKEKNEEAGLISVYYIDYESPEKKLKPLLINLKTNVHFIESHNGKFICEILHENSNGKVVEIDPENPLNWQEIVPEFSNAVLTRVIPLENRIICLYKSNQRPIISITDYSGKVLYSTTLAAGTSIGGFTGEYEDKVHLFSYRSYTMPTVVFEFNIETFERKLFENQQTAVSFDFRKFEYKDTVFTSKDGTETPIILVYNKGIELDGNNPTLLTAYGGFGAIATPTFDPGIVYFLQKGGVFAFANIRGGGDLGIEWAWAGRRDEKQNSFDDFISAAEFLIESKYTNPSKLAITGGSHGGLVVAAAALQRPELFKVVVPDVGVFDMIRLEKFTVGVYHIDEFGTTKDSLDFLNLLSYSPLHNIKEDVNYPAMLILTSEYDDRVPPFHSYKFAAKLQNREAQKNPIILRVEEKSGHYGSAKWMKSNQEKADIYGFILNYLRD